MGTGVITGRVIVVTNFAYDMIPYEELAKQMFEDFDWTLPWLCHSESSHRSVHPATALQEQPRCRPCRCNKGTHLTIWPASNTKASARMRG